VNKEAIFFVGIGGIGMSGLAQYFLLKGHHVAGYDRVLTPLTEKLSSLGAQITNVDASTAIPVLFRDPKNVRVIYTPAIPESSHLLTYFKDNGFILKKRAEVIGEISHTMSCLAVAGTHGKTTTSALLTHLLRSCGKKVTAFLGGIATNIDSNFLLEGNDFMVVEADEFDKSFMYLKPTSIALTSMDADHLDIYGTSNELSRTFNDFAKKVPAEKRFIANGLPVDGNIFGIEAGSHKVHNLHISEGNYIFDFVTPTASISNLTLSYPGKHNVMNTAAALALAFQAGCELPQLKEGLATFKGVDRRFSIRITKPKVVIDDYAHHPTEINAVADALEDFYPNHVKLGVFQPHLFSRTRDFVDGFKQALARFDQVFLLDIYPARELPIEGITSALLVDDKHDSTQLLDKQSLPGMVSKSCATVVAIMGAGDIAFEVPAVIQNIKNQYYA
jgi:UDP-N-acetylmuramate--alanine ligase